MQGTVGCNTVGILPYAWFKNYNKIIIEKKIDFFGGGKRGSFLNFVLNFKGTFTDLDKTNY